MNPPGTPKNHDDNGRDMVSGSGGAGGYSPESPLFKVPRPPVTSTPSAGAIAKKSRLSEAEVSGTPSTPPAPSRLGYNTCPTKREAKMAEIQGMVEAFMKETNALTQMVEEFKDNLKAKVDTIIANIDLKFKTEMQQRQDYMHNLIEEIENTDGEVEILEKELASFAKGMECFVKDIKEEH